MDDAVTTAAWTDEEAEALAIQPAKALAFAAAAGGGKGYTQPKKYKKKKIYQLVNKKSSRPITQKSKKKYQIF